MNSKKLKKDNNKKILELLENKNMTFDELNNKLGKEKRITYNLCKLLKEEKIRITGVRPECKNFAQKHIVFEKIVENRYAPSKILDLINDINAENDSIRKKAKKELKELFENKLKELQLLNQRKWDKYADKVNYRRINNKEAILYYVLKKYEKKYGYSEEEILDKEHIFKDFSDDISELKHSDDYYHILGDYGRYERWSIEGMKISILQSTFKEGEMTKEDFLKKFGIKLEVMDLKKRADLFDKVLFYLRDLNQKQIDYDIPIYTDPEIVKGKLALGLSNIQESKEMFNDALSDIKRGIRVLYLS